MRVQFIGAEQLNFTGFRFDDFCLHHAADARVLRLGERFRNAVLAGVESVLLEPCKRPARVRVEIALLLGKDFIERLVYHRKGVAHGDRLSFNIEDFCITREHRHARLCRLRQIHGRNVAALQIF